MTNQNFPRRLLDDAIDRAVRELVHADPRPGLRRRVIDRINAPRTSWLPALFVPVAALGAVLLAVMLMWPQADVPATPVASAPPAPAADPAPVPSAPVADSTAAKTPTPPRAAKRDEPVQFTFGSRSDRVTATSVPAAQAAQKPGEAAPASTGRTEAQAVNVRVEVTMTEHREGSADVPRTLSLLVADRDRAQVQSGGAGDLVLRVTARPEILSDQKVRVSLNLNYRGPRTDTDRQPIAHQQDFASIVDSGKPVVVTQWNETGSTRSVKVELKATIQR